MFQRSLSTAARATANWGPRRAGTFHPSTVISYLASDPILAANLQDRTSFIQFLNHGRSLQAAEAAHFPNLVGLSLAHRPLFNFANKWYFDRIGILHPARESDVMLKLYQTMETDFGKTVEVVPFTEADILQIRLLSNTIKFLAANKKMQPEEYMHAYPEILLQHARARARHYADNNKLELTRECKI